MNIDIEKLLCYAKGLANAKILVVGDLALDEMVYGDTERISREAPVLILRHTHTNLILGAASNAAHNVATINGGKVGVVGIVGDDYQANDLRKAFEDAGIDCSALVVDNTRKTVTKTRISGSCFQSITQQIVRIDRQSSEPLSDETENKILDKLEKVIPDYDAVILSDYHIGTLTDKVIKKVIDICSKSGKKVIVDGQKELQRYKGATTMTPNLPDTQKHVGFFIKSNDDMHKAGKRLLKDMDSEYVLITCGEEGMALVQKNGQMIRIPVFNKSKVFDVTGAGDTVTALYGLALASGAEPVYAAILGNIAAGIVIKQFGCATTTIDELIDFIEQNRRKLEKIELGVYNE
ncbi:MAG: bifunctional hydroxymethylpyrimidine kinase/phosphomethylpyrimidine kinase [Cyanobacteria bacterium RUI128]|nr:bifunctional hydroxymethylpyrimidine kinase/phosphomethylpyrimidine kinase [Cyanobacteria bacterium RUI128]